MPPTVTRKQVLKACHEASLKYPLRWWRNPNDRLHRATLAFVLLYPGAKFIPDVPRSGRLVPAVIWMLRKASATVIE